MAMSDSYLTAAPTRDALESTDGPVLVEFGAPWCGFCIGAQDALRSAFTAYPNVRHIKVEDGKGQPLGRSFRVRLWPTLIFMRNGMEVDRLVRPTEAEPIRQRLERVSQSEC